MPLQRISQMTLPLVHDAIECSASSALGQKKNSGSKRLQHEARERKARHRRARKRLRQVLILAGVALVIALFVFDQSAPVEIVDAEVISTERWRHLGQEPPHSHTRATLSLLGQTEVKLERADGLVTGQNVPVKIKKGRLTGWITYQELVTPIGL